jgi:hypothetical protein
MKWAEIMKGNATVAVPADVADDESGLRRSQAASWDPFEVWLTRIKRPRDNAASSAPAGPSSGIADRLD